MEITDIIGKQFVPPFKVLEKCIRDKNNNILLNFDSIHCYDLESWNMDCIIAQHICDLLNKEHYEKIS